MKNEPQSKMTMAALCFCLGLLGVHRKLMGYDKWWLMIVVTILTFGFGGCLWASIDLIRILTGNLKMANGENLR